MKRRTLLAGVPTLAAPGIAGCSSLLDDGTELLRVTVANMYEETRSVEVRIEHDGDVVEESTHELDPWEGEDLDCAWPSEPGRFVVSGRFAEDEEWVERELSDFDSGCATVTVSVHMSGNLQLSWGDTCDPPGETC